MKRRKSSPELIRKNPDKIILTFSYPLNQDVTQQVMKSILKFYRNEIQEGTVDYFKKKKDGSIYFILYRIPDTCEDLS